MKANAPRLSAIEQGVGWRDSICTCTSKFVFYCIYSSLKSIIHYRAKVSTTQSIPYRSHKSELSALKRCHHNGRHPHVLTQILDFNVGARVHGRKKLFSFPVASICNRLCPLEFFGIIMASACGVGDELVESLYCLWGCTLCTLRLREVAIP